MAYKYRSKRVATQIARKSRTNFITTLILIAILFYATITWVLPFLVNSVGSIKNSLNPSKKVKQVLKDSSLAPPILNISYEATNTAQIDIKGYGAPHSKVAIFIDDEKRDTAEVSNEGTFIVSNIQLGLGTNNIYGKSIDDSSHESLSSKIFKVLYDNEKPKLEVSEPEDNKKIQGGDEHSSSSNKKVKIAGRTDSGIKIFINDDQVIVDKDGNFSSIQNLNEGDNDFSIKAVDIASNTTEVQRKVIYQP